MTEQMAVVYLNGTNHVLAVVHHSATPPALAAVVGDGLRVAGVRGAWPATVLGYGAPTSQQERFVVPASQLSMRVMPMLASAFSAPHRYLVDTTALAELPAPLDLRDVSVTLGETAVQIGSTDLISPGISFPVETQIYVQVEGPDPSDRRIVRGTFPANQSKLFQFALTVEPGGPLAPIAKLKRYFVLVMIEGKSPDARTVSL